jgi:hypothetical protein
MATVVTESDSRAVDEVLSNSETARRPPPADPSRRRFSIAAMVGTAIVFPFELFYLWDLWSGTLNPLRAVPYDNFYDLQARAIFHGHLYLPNGKMGIEAFVHNGRDYTYFGLFPSIIRMPILLLTASFDGKMTAPSILLAWFLTALFSALILWRLRVLMRGGTVLGRAEAASYGALMATIMGGSVVLYLAATPFIFNEDFAWSIPLTVGSLFALLGVLEKPTRGRVMASGVLILCANLDRSPPGWGCSIAALLIAGWFALGRGGTANRRWALPMVAVGLIPFLVSCVVTYAKFGIPVGLPMADQVWAQVNAHRRYFLAANGGKAFSFAFLPSTLWAYFQPGGIRFGGLFPFITPPAAPASWLAGAVLDQSYPTASFTDTSPLLILLGFWGVVTAFRPRAIGQVRLTRIILFGAVLGAGGVLVWGYIAERYLADLMPFFIIAGGIALIDLWRRLEHRSMRIRGVVLGALATAGVYCVAANLAIATFPVPQWLSTQSERFLSLENSLSIDSLAHSVARGTTLPYWAPAGEVFAMDNCSGLYLSSGDATKNVPGQRIEHYSWMPVEQSPAFHHVIGFTFNRPVSDFTHGLTVMTYGKTRLVMEPAGTGYVDFRLFDTGTVGWPPPIGWRFPITSSELHQQLQIIVTIDPNLQSLTVGWYDQEVMINHFVAGDGPAVVKPTKMSPGAPLPAVTIANVAVESPADYFAPEIANYKTATSLCRSLTQDS